MAPSVILLTALLTTASHAEQQHRDLPAAGWRREAASCAGLLPLNHSGTRPPVPCTLVPTCSSVRPAGALGFRLLGDGGEAQQHTSALLCHTPTGLHISYTAVDNNIASNFSRCQDPVWRMDALEFMIYPGAMSADPGGNYSEIDLSPNASLQAHTQPHHNLICRDFSERLLVAAAGRGKSVRNFTRTHSHGVNTQTIPTIM